MSDANERRAENPQPATLEDVLEGYVMSDGGPSVTALAEWVRRYPAFEEALTSLTARWGVTRHLPDAPAPDEPDEETLVLRGMSVVHSLLHGQRWAQPIEADRPAPMNPAADLAAVVDGRVRPMRPTRADEASAHRKRLGSSQGDEGSVDALAGPLAGSPAPSTTPFLERTTPLRGLLTEAARCELTPDALADATGLSVPLLRKLDRRLIVADTIPRRVSEGIAGALGRDLLAVLGYCRLAPSFALRTAHRANQAPTLPTKLEDFFDAVRADPELPADRQAALLALEAPGPPRQPDTDAR